MATTLDKPQGSPSAPPPQTAPPPAQQPMEPLLVQCASCGSPIAFDQTYCLECGAKNARGDGWLSRFRTRRYVLGGLAVLLAIGGIVGYAAAAANRHDDVKIATKAVPPPAPAAPAPAATTPPAGQTPVPAIPAPAKPPIPVPAKPATPPPAAHPSTPAPSASTPSNPSTSTTPNSSGGTQHQAQPPSNGGTAHKPAYAQLFSTGRSPVGAGAFDPNHMGGTKGNTLSRVFDNDAGTVWTSGAYPSGVGSGVGFYVDDGASGTNSGLGLLTKTPGFDVQVYGYNGDTPPQALSDWTQIGSKTNAGQRNKIPLSLGGKQYQLYLVWFTKLPAKGQVFAIPEVQLIP